MRVNALLVRWAGGYTTRDYGETPVREGFLSIPDVRDVFEIDAMAEAEFDRFGGGMSARNVTLTRDSNAMPFEDFDLGDFITIPAVSGNETSQVTGLTVTEDPEGGEVYNVDFDPLNVDEDPDVTVKRWLDRMAPGSLKGRSEFASPITGAGAKKHGVVKSTGPWTARASGLGYRSSAPGAQYTGPVDTTGRAGVELAVGDYTDQDSDYAVVVSHTEAVPGGAGAPDAATEWTAEEPSSGRYATTEVTVNTFSGAHAASLHLAARKTGSGAFDNFCILNVSSVGTRFNISDVASVTGSRGGNAALASLLTALDTLGIINDSTTA